MRKSFLIGFAAATLLSAGAAGARTTADATSAPPPPAALDASLVREAAIVCGGNGCTPVHTKAEKKRKFQTLGHG